MVRNTIMCLIGVVCALLVNDVSLRDRVAVLEKKINHIEICEENNKIIMDALWK